MHPAKMLKTPKEAFSADENIFELLRSVWLWMSEPPLALRKPTYIYLTVKKEEALCVVLMGTFAAEQT